MKIDWKDADKALTKLYPREVDPEDEDDVAEPGSFFNFFEQENDPMDVSCLFVVSTVCYGDETDGKWTMCLTFIVDQIGVTIANDVFAEAIDYFLGNVGGEELDSEDEEDEEDDEDAEEIDLEKPRSKKRRV